MSVPDMETSLIVIACFVTAMIFLLGFLLGAWSF